jgi:transcriptional/translational regulatory protein YebC/TACO1
LQLLLRCAFSDFGHVAKALEDRKITPLSSELEYIPQTPTHLPDDQANMVLKLVDSLEQDEDVQRVFHNLG